MSPEEEEVVRLEKELEAARVAVTDLRLQLRKAEEHEHTTKEALEEAKKRAGLETHRKHLTTGKEITTLQGDTEEPRIAELQPSAKQQKKVPSWRDEESYSRVMQKVTCLQRECDMTCMLDYRRKTKLGKRLEKAKVEAEKILVSMITKRMNELEDKDPELRVQCEQYALDCVDEGIIHWEVESMLVGEEEIFSDDKIIGGFPFRLGCKINRDEMFPGLSAIEVKAYCSDDASNKACWASVAVALQLPQYPGGRPPPHPPSVYFTTDSPGAERILHFSLLNARKTCFFINDNFIFDVKIKVLDYYKNMNDRRTAPAPINAEMGRPDVALLVGEKVFRANKAYLAHFSEYFQTMFFSEFAEKDKDVIELGYVDAISFEAMLGIMSGAVENHKEIIATSEGIAGLLHAADFFRVDAVLWKCSDFLMSCMREKRSSFSHALILQLAQELRLYEIKHKILSNIDEITRAIMYSPEFDKLADSLQMYILQEYINLSSNPAPPPYNTYIY